MKIVASVLLFVISINSVFCYLYFHVSMMQAKSEAVALISNIEDYDQPELIKVPSYKLEKDESDEVWYGGNLYDVAKREMIRDTEYVYILHDQREENLLEKISDYFTTDEKPVSVHPAVIRSCRNIRPIVNKQYIMDHRKVISIYSISHKRLTLAAAYNLHTCSTDVLTPPPKNF